MKKFIWYWLLLAAIAPVAVTGDEPKKDETKTEAKAKSPKEQFQSIADEFNKARSDYMTAARAAKTPEGRKEVIKKLPNAADFADRMLTVAEANPTDDAAVEALSWVVSNSPSGPKFTVAMERLAKDHVTSSKIAGACQALERSRSPVAHEFLKAVVEKNTHPEVLGRALLGLAGSLKVRIDLKGLLEGMDPAMLERVTTSYGAEYLAAAKALKDEEANREIEKLYERIEKDPKIAAVLAYGPTAPPPYNMKTLSDVAARSLFEIRHLSTGKTAPEIEAEDIEGAKFKLTDYRGKVVVLDFWGDW